MFIKLTVARLDENDKDLLLPSLVNTDDVKAFRLDPKSSKVYVVYRSYNELGEEEDEVQEDIKIIANRLSSAKLYVPEITTPVKL